MGNAVGRLVVGFVGAVACFATGCAADVTTESAEVDVAEGTSAQALDEPKYRIEFQEGRPVLQCRVASGVCETLLARYRRTEDTTLVPPPNGSPRGSDTSLTVRRREVVGPVGNQVLLHEVSILRFPMQGLLSAGALFRSATLTFQVSSLPDAPIIINLLDETWSEAEADYLQRDNGIHWRQFGSAPGARLTEFLPSAKGAVEVPVPADKLSLLQRWRNPNENFGIRLSAEASTTVARLSSSEGTVPPKLTIYFDDAAEAPRK